MPDPSKSTFTPIGVTGLTHYGGRVYEEYLTELHGDKWQRVVRAMQTHPLIGGAFFVIQMLIRQVQWSITPGSDDPADQEIAAFVDEALHDMRETWPLTLGEMLSMLQWGWVTMEVTHKQRRGGVARKDGTPDMLRSSRYDDGKIGWGAWSIRAQDSNDGWQFDEDGAPLGWYQLAPPLYGRTFIPLSKCIYVRLSARKGDPEGVSLLRHIYEAWYYETHIKRMEAIGIERDNAGIPFARIPGELLSSERTAEEATQAAAYEKIVTNLRNDEQAGVVFPSTRDESGNYLYELTLIGSPGSRQFDTDKVIQRYQTQMMEGLQTGFMLLGHQESGSWALASSKTTTMSMVLGAIIESITAAINPHIAKLVQLNGWNPEQYPELTHDDIETLDLNEAGAFLAALSNAGELFKGEGKLLYQFFLKQLGVPAAVIDAAGQVAPDAPAPPPPDQTIVLPDNATPPQTAAEPRNVDALLDAAFGEARERAMEVTNE